MVAELCPLSCRRGDLLRTLSLTTSLRWRLDEGTTYSW